MNRATARALRLSYGAAGAASLIFFALSMLLLGVRPGRVLERETAAMTPPHALGLTASEQRGRIIYGREGCAYCHTQQVRFTETDVARFGAPTLAWETQFDYPHLWGTRRIGPDLARAGAIHPDDWHYAHLYAPRAIVPESVMPAYAALFDGAPDRPRQTARDLVAYLQSLGRARELAGAGAPSPAKGATPPVAAGGAAPMAKHTTLQTTPQASSEASMVLNASPARARRGGDVPAPLMTALLTTVPVPGVSAPGADGGRNGTTDPSGANAPFTLDLARGRLLYARNCAGCHGARGEGDGPGAAGLRPRPTNLAAREYTRARLGQTLWNGVAGTAMPAWRDHAIPDLAAIAQVVREFRPPASVAPASAAAGEMPTMPASPLLAQGARIYAVSCAPCHGETGGGDGYAARELRIAPTSFRLQRADVTAALRAVRDGVEGTQMAAWSSRLTDADLLAAVHYVRTLFQPDAGGDRRH